jgi:serine protease Do
MGVIEDLQAAISGVASTAGSAIVSIGSQHRGSGVVIADGRVVTNAHNIRGDEVTVAFADGRSTRGTLAGIDVDGDLAVISVDTAGARPLTWGDSATLVVGAVVFGAAGARGGSPRVTVGTVSAVSRAFRGPGGRRISGSVEHTAPLAPGSSGGALLNAQGHLVAINTNRIGEGFYLALPADAALRTRLELLGSGQTVERPRLGVAVAPPHVAARLRRSVGLPDRAGLLVTAVDQDSAAARAGIREGDLIVAVAGVAVADADGLVDAVATAALPYEVRIVRGAEEHALTAGEAGPA